MAKAFIRHLRRTAKLLLGISLISSVFLPISCIATESLAAKPGEAEVFVPSLFDPRNRAVAPDAPFKKPIRFLTADDYPPFEFLGADGALAGYNIEIARALCDELKLSCTIQPRRWDNLLDALDAGEGDAVIASLREGPATAGKARFTAPYYLTPARFVSLAGGPGLPGGHTWDVRPEGLRHATIGVEAGSAHEAFLRAFYEASEIKPFPDRDGLLAALRGKKVDLVFGDAITLAIWMNGAAAQDCCAFQGGPFLEPAYFGTGIGIGLRPDDDTLRKTLDWALQRLNERGVMTELYLKYFPIGIY